LRKKKRFWSPFEQVREHNGKRFVILKKISKPDRTHDREVLPMYRIRFLDGIEIEAFPEEIYTQR